MVEICQRVLDECEVPVEWALGVVVPIFMGKDDIMNCSCHENVKLFEH